MHMMSVPAQRSLPIETPRAELVWQRCNFGGLGVAAGSSSSPWPAPIKRRWSSCQRLKVGV